MLLKQNKYYNGLGIHVAYEEEDDDGSSKNAWNKWERPGQAEQQEGNKEQRKNGRTMMVFRSGMVWHWCGGCDDDGVA